ncbi:type I methionyl aminopeptidase [Verrucomicrobiota bacterium]
MIIIKNSSDIEGMRASGQIAAKVRNAVCEKICPGATTGELSDYAGELIREFGAKSAFLGYKGFPGQICVSVNEAVVHGVPGKKRIKLEDIVSIDVGVKYCGYIGDTATTVMVGVTDPEVIRLVKTAEQALAAGINMAKAGNRLSDISHAIEQTSVEAGFNVVREFVGHGIGRKMHEDPQIPNFGSPGHGPSLKSGMTLALEPMLNMGGFEVEIHKDGWTVLTQDRRLSAHFEHTIAVMNGTVENLTF